MAETVEVEAVAPEPETVYEPEPELESPLSRTRGRVRARTRSRARARAPTSTNPKPTNRNPPTSPNPSYDVPEVPATVGQPTRRRRSRQRCPAKRRRHHVHWPAHMPHVEPDRMRDVGLPAAVVTVAVLVAMAIAGVFGGAEPAPATGSATRRRADLPRRLRRRARPARRQPGAAAEIARQALREQRRADAAARGSACVASAPPGAPRRGHGPGPRSDHPDATRPRRHGGARAQPQQPRHHRPAGRRPRR